MCAARAVCCVVITQWQWATSMKWHLPLVGVSPVFFLCGEGVCTNSSIVNYSSFWLHLAYSVHSTDMPLLKNRSGKYWDIMLWYITKCKFKSWWEAQTYIRYSLNAPLPVERFVFRMFLFVVCMLILHWMMWLLVSVPDSNSGYPKWVEFSLVARIWMLG